MEKKITLVVEARSEEPERPGYSRDPRWGCLKPRLMQHAAWIKDGEGGGGRGGGGGSKPFRHISVTKEKARKVARRLQEAGFAVRAAGLPPRSLAREEDARRRLRGGGGGGGGGQGGGGGAKGEESYSRQRPLPGDSPLKSSTRQREDVVGQPPQNNRNGELSRNERMRRRLLLDPAAGRLTGSSSRPRHSQRRSSGSSSLRRREKTVSQSKHHTRSRLQDVSQGRSNKQKSTEKEKSRRRASSDEMNHDSKTTNQNKKKKLIGTEEGGGGGGGGEGPSEKWTRLCVAAGGEVRGEAAFAKSPNWSCLPRDLINSCIWQGEAEKASKNTPALRFLSVDPSREKEITSSLRKQGFFLSKVPRNFQVESEQQPRTPAEISDKQAAGGGGR